jgi:hypothetical protein
MKSQVKFVSVDVRPTTFINSTIKVHSSCIQHSKGEGRVAFVHAKTAHRWSRGIAPVIRNFGATWKLRGQHQTSAALYPGNEPSTY